METISKPHLVDLLRTFDRYRWIMPRIRYASVRSKGELIEDLRGHFTEEVDDTGVVTLVCRRRAETEYMPAICYDPARRSFLLDGHPVDLPRKSREPLRFRCTQTQTTLTFPGPLKANPDPAAGWPR
jgi:hypothetical protein